jgi:hypothetical protein
MGTIAAKLAANGWVLPPPLPPQDGMQRLFEWVSIRGDRVFVAGHGAQAADGSLAGPFGSVGAEVTFEQARELAGLTALSMLGSLERALGDLDRIAAWCRVFGMVNSAPGFGRQPAVINGFSERIIALFGAEVGRHTRSAVGMAALPFGMAIEIEAELLLRS